MGGHTLGLPAADGRSITLQVLRQECPGRGGGSVLPKPVVGDTPQAFSVHLELCVSGNKCRIRCLCLSVSQLEETAPSPAPAQAATPIISPVKCESLGTSLIRTPHSECEDGNPEQAPQQWVSRLNPCHLFPADGALGAVPEESSPQVLPGGHMFPASVSPASHLGHPSHPRLPPLSVPCLEMRSDSRRASSGTLVPKVSCEARVLQSNTVGKAPGCCPLLETHRASRLCVSLGFPGHLLRSSPDS